MAEDTGTDIIFPVINQFCNPFLIRKEITGESGSVNPAFTDRLRSRLGRESACTYNRDINKLPDMLNIFKITVLRHINGRMRPVPRVVCSVIAIEHIVSGILQKLCSLLRLFHISSHFFIILAGKSSLSEAFCFGYHTVTQGYRKIIPALFLNGFNYLCRKPVSVLKASAVFIITLIDI